MYATFRPPRRLLALERLPVTSSPHTPSSVLAQARLEQAELLEQLQHTAPDSREHRAARERLVELNTPLVRHLVRRYAGSTEPSDDLLQVGMVGLVQAINRYDPSRCNGFAAFAVPTVLGELKRYFRDQTWSVHVPRSVHDLHLRVGSVSAELAQRLGREPTVPELAAETGATSEQVLLAIFSGRNRSTQSLDATPDTDDGGPALDPPARDDSMEQVEDSVVLGPALRQLSPRSRRVLKLRFVEDKTQVEIAGVLGVSQMQVSRLISRSLTQLRETLQENGMGPSAGPAVA